MFQNKIIINIVKVIIGLIITFIWVQSLLPKSVSRSESGYILNIIKELLGIIIGKENVTAHVVRKIAHFVEFFSLGLFVSLHNILKYGYYSKKNIISLIFCLLIASVDETIQIFSNRGPGLLDILLDFSGSFLAFVIVWLIIRKVTLKKNWRFS